MIQALIFDYGGTLDTNALHWSHVLWEAYRDTMDRLPQAAGLSDVTWEQFRTAYVYGERTLGSQPIIRPDDTFPTVLLKKVELETRQLVESGLWHPAAEERKAVVESIASYCDGYVQRNLETSRRVLQHFADRYTLILVSNFYGNIRAILRDYRLEYFKAVIESAEVGIRKPDPAIYRLGVEAAGVPVDQCVVIGDSFGKDIVPARLLGCETVWLKGRGWDRETVDEGVPTHIITDLSQLLSLY